MIYNLILVLSLPFVLPVFLLLAALNPRYRAGLFERLGFWSLPSSMTHPPSPTSSFFWIHAASVGEVQAAWPLVEELARRYPSGRFLFTTLTLTGRALVRQKRMRGDEKNALVRLFPADLPWIASRLLKRLRPDLILLVETELWPNFLKAARRQAIPIAIVNGRISPPAFSRYRVIRFLLRPVLSGVERFLMQTSEDAKRITDLGAPPHRVIVVGNLKFDQKPSPLSEADQEGLRARWRWKAADPVWVAGSTHPGEEEQIIQVFLSLKREHPDLRLILAPRYIERVSEIKDLLAGHRLTFGLTGETHPPFPLTPHSSPVDVILVNTLGELARLYSLAHVVFVGGSLAPVGGHNLVEPALLGKPVLFGPHIEKVKATAELLIQSGGGIPITDTRSLEKEIRALLKDQSLRIQWGEQARKTVHQHQGAVHKTAGLISDWVASARLKRVPRFDRRSPIQRWLEESLWSSRGGGLTPLASAGLGAAAILYGGILRAREACYRVQILRSRKLSRPVISVGNLTLGGTGKTPTVIALCQLLLKKGLRPAVLSRGYGGHPPAPVLTVSDGDAVKQIPDVAGDEPVLLARKLPGVPVLIGTDRVKVGQAAIAAYHPDVLIMDDGFQHRRLYRDLDLVLLNAADPFGNGQVLPRGPLREPISHLRRAHALLLTHVESREVVKELVASLRQICPDRPCFLSRHHLTGWVPLGAGQGRPQAGRVMIVTGIARPQAFLKSMAQAGLDIVRAWIAPDHYPFSQEDVTAIEQEAYRVGAEAIVTTEKDAVRLGSLSRPLEGWWVAEVSLEVFDPIAWEKAILAVI